MGLWRFPCWLTWSRITLLRNKSYNTCSILQKIFKTCHWLSGGFWCSKDTYLNVTPDIAVKCKGPTQQKYSWWENLYKGTPESIWKSSKRRTNKNKRKVINSTVLEKNNGAHIFIRLYDCSSPLCVQGCPKYMKAIPYCCLSSLFYKTSMDEDITVSQTSHSSIALSWTGKTRCSFGFTAVFYAFQELLHTLD